MRNRSGVAILLAVLLLQASPLAAQTRPVAAQSVEFEVKADLVRRYFVVIQFEKLMTVSMESMTGPMLESTPLPEDKIALMREAVLAAYAVVLPQMIEANIAIYAEAFTVEELEGLVAFYESPLGQSVMVKSVMLSRGAGEVFERFQPLLQEEMTRQMCVRIDCPANAMARRAPAKR
jgi:hypothetical protein